MTKERKIKFYTTMLTHYLLFYGGLHLLAMIVLFGFERGWGGFAYFLLFWWHLPIMLIGGILAFLGKKRQSATIWLLILICFILANGWWLYMFLYTGGAMVMILPLMLTTAIPIFASLQLFRMTKTPLDSL